MTIKVKTGVFDTSITLLLFYQVIMEINPHVSSHTDSATQLSTFSVFQLFLYKFDLSIYLSIYLSTASPAEG